MTTNSSLVLLSGGLDSLACFYWAQKKSNVKKILTFDYGQKAAIKEIEKASHISKKENCVHQIIKLDWFLKFTNNALVGSLNLPQLKNEELDEINITFDSAKAVWVPNRNGVMINIAASIAEAENIDWIIIGFNREEAITFPDNSPDFLKAANQFLKYSTNEKVVLKAPMIEKNKTEILNWLLENKIDLNNLWSCYKGESKMCGTCESCMRLVRALKNLNASQWLKELF